MTDCKEWKIGLRNQLQGDKMLASTKVMDALKNIGLNLYERKIYIALLAKGIASAAMLSEISGVPRSRSYDILQSLSEKGFVMLQASKPIKYVALTPTDALDRIKQIMKDKHKEMLTRIDSLKNSDILNELNRIHKNGLNMVKPHEMTGTFKGIDAINSQLKSVFKDAKSSIDILVTENGLKNLYSNHIRTLKKVSKKGVKIKIAAPFVDKKVLKDFSEIAEVKHVETPLGRVITIDNNHALFSLSDDNEVHETQDVMLWTSSSHAAKVLNSVFSQVWHTEKKE